MSLKIKQISPFQYNIVENGKLLLPFNVNEVYIDFVIRIDNPKTHAYKFNLFNKNTKKIHFPYWFDEFSKIEHRAFKIDNIIYSFGLCRVKINDYINYVDYNGNLLFNKWFIKAYGPLDFTGSKLSDLTQYKNYINFNIINKLS